MTHLIRPPSSAELIRQAFGDLDAGAAWPANKEPGADDIFTPLNHRNALDLSRILVVGNRGVGKTFWSHALWSQTGREIIAQAYNLAELRSVDAVFGFQGSFSKDNAPSAAVVDQAMQSGINALTFWQAVLLKAYGREVSRDLPSDFVGLAKWFADNPEAGDTRIRDADADRSGRPLIVLFDALDTLANDWIGIRRRTEGLLRLAVLSKGLHNTKLKIFMRPDQFEDATLFRFPDASKLRAERVSLEWKGSDLYALMFFHLWRNEATRIAVQNTSGTFKSLFVKRAEQFVPNQVRYAAVQRLIFNNIAGEWMGSEKKRGATYSWLIQHLADANDETTPRAFLTALRGASNVPPLRTDLAIDYRGITNGVAEASENRVADLLQDYWWIDYIKAPLVGMHTPVDRETLLETWRINLTAQRIRDAPATRGLLPVFLALRENINELPPHLAEIISSDEEAILESLRLISVCEIRPNKKVNFPDIFRVAFKMKRRGGVPPKRAVG